MGLGNGIQLEVISSFFVYSREILEALLLMDPYVIQMRFLVTAFLVFRTQLLHVKDLRLCSLGNVMMLLALEVLRFVQVMQLLVTKMALLLFRLKLRTPFTQLHMGVKKLKKSSKKSLLRILVLLGNSILLCLGRLSTIHLLRNYLLRRVLPRKPLINLKALPTGNNQSIYQKKYIFTTVKINLFLRSVKW